MKDPTIIVVGHVQLMVPRTADVETLGKALDVELGLLRRDMLRDFERQRDE